jgi:hypothetical protein
VPLLHQLMVAGNQVQFDRLLLIGPAQALSGVGRATGEGPGTHGRHGEPGEVAPLQVGNGCMSEQRGAAAEGARGYAGVPFEQLAEIVGVIDAHRLTHLGDA